MKTFQGHPFRLSPAPSRIRWLRDLCSAVAAAWRAGRKRFREEREWQARINDLF